MKSEEAEGLRPGAGQSESAVSPGCTRHREPQATYSNDFEAKNGLLSTKNACFRKTNL